MLGLQHQYNNCITIPHIRVCPTYWGPPSCEGLLYSCCIGVVQESNLFLQKENKKNNKILSAMLVCCGAVLRNECRDHFSFSLHIDANMVYISLILTITRLL